MAMFTVRVLEKITVCTTYHVEAHDAEEAECFYHDGELEYDKSEPIANSPEWIRTLSITSN